MNFRIFVALFAVLLMTVVLQTGCAKKKLSADNMTTQASSQSEDAGQAGAGAGAGDANAYSSSSGVSGSNLDEDPFSVGDTSSSSAAIPGSEEFKADLAVLSDHVFFGFDSFELKPESRELLQKKADILKNNKKLTMVIEGNCDNRGTEEYNLALGERRAKAAYEFLILLGVSPERLSIVSFGEENPLDPANNETAWAKNRRDDFRINQ